MITSPFIVAALFAASLSAPAPNVVWVVLDACRADHLSPYGYVRDTTPYLNALAEEGVTFLDNYSQAGYTVHSLPSYMTGRYFPVQCLSFLSPFETWRTPPPEEQLAPEIFRANGYATGLISACPWIAPSGRLSQAFDHANSLSPDESQAYAPLNALTAATLEWLATLEKDKPFFLYLHAMDTHFPHQLRAGFDTWVPGDPRPDAAEGAASAAPFDTVDKVQLSGLYDGSLRYADLLLRNLLSSLYFRGQLDNTIVIVGADHGDVLGEDGVTIQHPPNVTTDEVYHVPLIVRGPGIRQGARIAAMTENVDILPTLVDFLGLKTGAGMDGKSLAAALREDAPVPEHDFSLARHYEDEDFRVVLSGPAWKYVAGWERIGPLWWERPDAIADRHVLAEPSGVLAASVDRVWETTVMPAWSIYRDRPLTRRAPFSIQLSAGSASPRRAFTQATGPNDNRWTVAPDAGIYCAAGERPPNLALRFHVPNARYAVRIGMIEALPLPTVTVTGATQEALPADPTDATLLGHFDVSDETFTIMLHAPPGDSGARLLYFDPIIDAGPLQRNDDMSPQEQLRALGYL